MGMELDALRMLQDKTLFLIDLIKIKEQSLEDFKKVCDLDEYIPIDDEDSEVILYYLYESPHKIEVFLPFKISEIKFETFYKDKRNDKYFQELKEEVIEYLENLIYQ